jgi:hypothetical protein
VLYLYINKKYLKQKEKGISLNHQKNFSMMYEYGNENDDLMWLKNNVLENWSKIFQLNVLIMKIMFMIVITETSKN